jgi:Glycosyltransferase family 9 (heptosyltransferase)
MYIFVTTPWYEPFGITSIEAMACGTPVIGARVGGIKSTVVDGKTGFLIELKDHGTLASHGLRIVLTGSAEEAGLTQAVAQLMRNPSLDFAGCTSLGAVAALLSRARLLICNDTGVSHIAAALQLPGVVICCGSDPARWAPLDRELHRIVYHPIGCRPCAHTDCPIGHPCVLEVSMEAVIEQAMELLSRGCCYAAATNTWRNTCDARQSLHSPR